MIVANWKMNGSREEVDSWLRFVSTNILTNNDKYNELFKYVARLMNEPE